MPNALGVYFCPTHGRQSDKDYIQALQPPAIRLLDPDVQQLIDAHALAPHALLLPRDWALSEQKEDMARDPEGTGIRHAQDWRGKIDKWVYEAAQRGATLPGDSHWVVVGINEPEVWHDVEAPVRYTVAFLDECAHLGLRACALNLSVGWPANTGPDTPPDWSPYAPVKDAILRFGHFLVVHEYWYWPGPQDGWGWYAGRMLACPWDVPILIGECGVDCYCDNERWQNDGGNRGWQGHMTAEQYAGQLHAYLGGLDDRIMAILPFLTDYRDPQWSSFDTNAAHQAILAQEWDLFLPEFGDGSEPEPEPGPDPEPGQVQQGTVIAPAGLNVRSGPGADYQKLGALAYGSTVLWDREEAGWLQTVTGWVSGEYVGIIGAAPTPPQPPTPTGGEPSGSQLDPLAAEAVYQVESGSSGFGADGRMIIRFEAHVFEDHLNNPDLFRQYFSYGDPPWTGQMYRESPQAAWKPIHTGDQDDEWNALKVARNLNDTAGLLSITMGAAQILGSNYGRILHKSVQDMFEAFQRSLGAQDIGFFDFCLADPALVEAINNHDWEAVAYKYNGPGAVDTYAPLLESAYNSLAGE